MTIELNTKIAPLTAVCTGKPFSSKDYLGQKWVLYFYPKDATPGCTTQAEGFRDHHAEFQQHNCAIFGVSRDSLKSHENFKAKKELPFELISDPEETLCQMFGVMKQKNMYGKQVRGIERSTFVFNSKGVLVHAWRGVKVPGHVAEVLDFIKKMPD